MRLALLLAQTPKHGWQLLKIASQRCYLACTRESTTSHDGLRPKRERKRNQWPNVGQSDQSQARCQAVALCVRVCVCLLYVCVKAKKHEWG